MEKLLKNKDVSLFITSLAILVLIFKTAPVFRQLSFPNPSSNLYAFQFWFEWVSSFLSVTIIEIAVLLFIARGNKAESYAFAIVSFLSSLYYFNSFYFTDLRVNIMQFIWSLIYPFVIVRFSHFYKEKIEDNDTLMVQLSELKAEKDALNREKDAVINENSILKARESEFKASIQRSEAYLQSVEASLKRSKESIERLELQNENIKAEHEETKAKLKVWIDRHTCKSCNTVFDNIQQLSGHKKGCN